MSEGTLPALLVAALWSGALAAQSPYPAEVPLAPPATYADPRAAADSLEALLHADSLDYGANWRAAMALVGLGNRVPETVRDPVRDSLYRVAVEYARRALRVDSGSVEGHFVLALVLGRASLTRGGRQRVRDAEEIRREALRALAIDSLHDGAWHVLGRWHAEVRRLSGLQRFFARTFLGGGGLGAASWDGAVRALERAVALRPEWIVHRLALAQVYADVGRYAEAREQLRTILQLPGIDPMDGEHRRTAERLLSEWNKD